MTVGFFLRQMKCIVFFCLFVCLDDSTYYKGFPGGSAVNSMPANSGDVGLIPGSGRSPGEGNATHSSILARRVPWTEEPSGLPPMGLQNVGHDLGTKRQPQLTIKPQAAHKTADMQFKQKE